MKKNLLLILILMLSMVAFGSVPAGAAQAPGYGVAPGYGAGAASAAYKAAAGAGTPGKASSIDELVRMFDSTSCKACHAEIYAQWEQSHHARPLMGVGGGLFLTPLAMKGKTPFSPDSPEQATINSWPCFKCHLPQAQTSADDGFAVDLAKALIAQDKAKVNQLKITCLVCHNEKAIIHRLQDGKPVKGVVYGNKDMSDHGDPTHKVVKKSVIMDKAVFCGQCHGTGPNFDHENPYQCATLYGSYLHAYIPAGGTKTCQNCHMEKINGKADHLFSPNWNDKADATKRLQDNISLDVQMYGYEWLKKGGDLRPMVAVTTRIDHTAGHRIPDG